MIRIAAAVVVVAALSSAPAEACSCRERNGELAPALEEARAEATVVFRGRVSAVDPFPLLFMSRTRVTFEVLDTFKGSASDERVVNGGSGGGDCSIGYQVGEEWLVYAYRHWGLLDTSLCTRTRRVEPGDLELRWLRTGELPLRPVAMRRETVTCIPCNLETVTAKLVGGPQKNCYSLGEPEALTAWKEHLPFWTEGYYAGHAGPMTAVGLSAEGEPFQLVQKPFWGTEEMCRQRVSYQQCERLEQRARPLVVGGMALPTLECVSPGPVTLLCDESTTRKAQWGPLEDAGSATCNVNLVEPRTCRVPAELHALIAPAPAGPVLRCQPRYDWARDRVCSIGSDPVASLEP